MCLWLKGIERMAVNHENMGSSPFKHASFFLYSWQSGLCSHLLSDDENGSSPFECTHIGLLAQLVKYVTKTIECVRYEKVMICNKEKIIVLNKTQLSWECIKNLMEM